MKFRPWKYISLEVSVIGFGDADCELNMELLAAL